MTTSFSASSRLSSWNWRKLLQCHVIVLVLSLSFFWPPTSYLWEWVNVSLFRLLNGSLAGHPDWQLFWALSNHPFADWVADVFFLGFFTAAILSFPKGERLKKCAHFLFCCLFAGAVLYFVNHMVFRRFVHIYHPSPTLVFPEDCFKLSHHIKWLKVKDAARQSFPGDHGTTALLFAGSYASIAPRRLKILGCLYALFLCMPRMVTGAHWFSDIVLGSGSIVTICLAWAFYSPFCARCTEAISRFLKGVGNIGRKIFLPKKVKAG